MVNDGLLPLPPGQAVEDTQAGWLSGGLVMTSHWARVTNVLYLARSSRGYLGLTV